MQGSSHKVEQGRNELAGGASEGSRSFVAPSVTGAFAIYLGCSIYLSEIVRYGYADQSAVMGVLLGGSGVVIALRRLRRWRGTASISLRRWGYVSLAANLLGLLVIFSAPLFVPCYFGQKPSACVCAMEESQDKLWSMGEAVLDYRRLRGDGENPPDLGTLFEEGLLGSSTLIFVHTPSEDALCRRPIVRDGKIIGELDFIYIYLPGGAQAPGDLIRIYERPEIYRERGTYVLFASGEVSWMNMEVFRQRLAKTLKWVEKFEARKVAISAPNGKIPLNTTLPATLPTTGCIATPTTAGAGW